MRSEELLAPNAPELADAANAWTSAYVHIPFCARRCPYCDFAIVDESSEDADHARYVDAVIAEIGMEDRLTGVDAVNFGGGTPSRLRPADLGRILDAIESTIGIAGSAEVSLEVNPEDWSMAVGAELVDVGFNRISIGAQSLDTNILASWVDSTMCRTSCAWLTKPAASGSRRSAST